MHHRVQVATNQSAQKRLCAWVSDMGISQHELAEKLGVSPSYVSRVLGGQRSAGLAMALAIERESSTWEHGPILASEW